jgi:hypothetical protein
MSASGLRYRPVGDRNDRLHQRLIASSQTGAELPGRAR